MKKENFSKNVLAYRKIKKHKNKGKCNIDFAKDAFDIIKHNKRNSVVIVDISSFFDTLNHEYLLKNVNKILEKKYFFRLFLKKDIKYFLKHATEYAYIDLDNHKKEKKITGNSKYIQYNKKYYYCFRDANKQKRRDARKKIKEIIFKNQKKIGIPQGLSVSGVMSNIYMIDFDRKIADYAKKNNAEYFRYSDDIIFIQPINNIHESDKKIKSIFKTLEKEIKSIELNINKEKTQKVTIDCDNPNEKITYLGFHFDGKNIFLKPTTISRYYLSMSKLNRIIHRYFKKNQKKYRTKTTYENGYYQNPPPRGARLRWVATQNRSKQPNFISYFKKSCKIMESPTIERQLRRKVQILNKLIRQKWEKR